jgi:hypothetical protein
MLGAFYVFVDMHEQVHKSVYESFGIKSHIEIFGWNHLFTALTITEPINATQCPLETCQMQQNMVDNVGYHAQPIFVITGVGFLIMIVIGELILHSQLNFHRTLLRYDENQ